MIITLLKIWVVGVIITRLLIFIDEKTHNCNYGIDLKSEGYVLIFWWLFMFLYIFGISYILYEKIKRLI
jgi:hypothetical protein